MDSISPISAGDRDQIAGEIGIHIAFPRRGSISVASWQGGAHAPRFCAPHELALGGEAD